MARPAAPWSAPAGEQNPPKLHLYNSLTRKKEPFVPQRGKNITWYCCGPTVYDSAHMGHARAYMSFDILRRVLQDYFGYDITYVMNVTDIDDKIIKRARTAYLLSQYEREQLTVDRVVEDVMTAMTQYQDKLTTTQDPDKRTMYLNNVAKVKQALSRLQEAVSKSSGQATEEERKLFVDASRDVLGEWLDKARGHTITDNSIFMSLPQHFENEFNKDMKALNVLPADIVTRVSEYVPEIIAFVQKVVDNGFAYPSNGSVYFDVAKFDADKGHHYAKLVPEAYGNQEALQEGEGDLSVSEDRLKEKRSPNDFALWKASKPGEPSWESPWGPGRPGWHIECSAMASSILGDSMDIHTGGVDLKFPHHDNELAQSEAYYNNDAWVRYFLHAGHLHIDGCKMSKSLKNFISIQDALAQHPAHVLRLAFLLHGWKDTLDYSKDTMEGAHKYHKLVTEFHLNVADLVRRKGDTSNICREAELTLVQAFNKGWEGVRQAMCDSIDTRTTLDHLRDLMTQANKYMNNNVQVNTQLVSKVDTFVQRMMSIFGVSEHQQQQQGGTNNSQDKLALAQVVASVRERIRQLAVSETTNKKDLISLSDDIRDVLLPPLGVRLEDREAGEPSIKLVDPAELQQERDAKKAQEEAKRKEKEKRKQEQEAKQKEKAAQDAINPAEIFRSDSRYSKFDEQGIPTHDAEGNEITKSQRKKLEKGYEVQKKKYEKWLATQK